MNSIHRKPNILISIIPLLFLVIMLIFNVRFFGDTVLEGSLQILLLLSTALCCFLAMWKLKVKWSDLESGIINQIYGSIGAILILLLIGALSATWMLSGIVPSMIYYGIKMISPSVFLVTACVICAVISMSSGSSWTTVATIGVALLGVGKVLGFSEGWVAGAIISGAYFGDKISPLSDTTNLASSASGTNLFTHIRYMQITTVPSMIITLIIFFVYGLWGDHTGNIEVHTFNDALKNTYFLSAGLFIVPLITLVMIVKRVPALITLFISVLLGAVCALIFQPDLCKQLAVESSNSFEQYFTAIIKNIYGKTSVDTGNQILNNLVSTNGMSGMLNTIWLIMCAMCFGGAMEASRMLQTLTDAMIKWMKTTFSTVATTTGACFFMNVTTSDQYISIVLPAKMFSNIYRKNGLEPRLLSRTIEDSATVTSVLIPWNTCGMTQSAVLGVATITYLPYCFFNILSPIMTLCVAAIGYKIIKGKPLSNSEAEEPK